MATISLWWHMLVKENLDNVVLSMNSIANLYDGIVIGVDDGEESDGVAATLEHYPNTHIYRQHFDDFNSFGRARQDVLNRVPKCTYVGRSDDDEILMTDPYYIRKWLAETRPEAVRCATHYLYTNGWCQAGTTLREEGIRIWKYGTRVWTRPAHEYPYPINNIENWVDGDILFNHIKDDPPDSTSDRIIKLMRRAIDEGDREYLWFMAREYVVKGDIKKAISLCFEYLKHEVDHEEIFNITLWGMSELHKQLEDPEGLLQRLSEVDQVVPNNQEVQKYLDMAKELLCR